MRIILLTLLVAATLAAADPKQELIDADRAFAKETSARGLDGWMSWFAENASLNTPKGHLRGRIALSEYYKGMFARPGFSLKWEPFHAEISADGTLGYTLGTSVATARDSDGREQEHSGRYVTIWRRQRNGAWKVETDLGN